MIQYLISVSYTHLYAIDWTRRSLWDRNYSETRLPAVPSTIIELLSHQNFADMRLGHDPNFKFTVGRSIYKAILLSLIHIYGPTLKENSYPEYMLLRYMSLYSEQRG